MILLSSAFTEGDLIPARYTCDGEDLSPPLEWRDVPEGTETLALVMDDPDAPGGTWVHWVVFNLPATASGLPEGASGSRSLPKGSVEGQNGWGRPGYGGACPPSGTHRYFFRLLALDGEVALGPSASADDLSRSIDGHVVSQTTLMGRYARA